MAITDKLKLWKSTSNSNDEPDRKKEPTKLSSMKKHYRNWLIIFGISLAVLIFSPVVTGENHTFEGTPVGTKQYLAQNIPAELVKAEWNPENGLFRMDLNIQTDPSNPRLANIEISEIFTAFIDNPSQQIEDELIKVSSSYYIYLAHVIPKGFDVLGVGIDPNFIEPDIEDNATTMENKKLQYYFHEDEIIQNASLEIESYARYRVDYIDQWIRELEDSIAESKENIRLGRIRIENLETTIADLDLSTQFKTEEEIEEQERDLKSLEIDIDREKLRIENEKEKIDTYENRVQLYESEKEDILSGEQGANNHE